MTWHRAPIDLSVHLKYNTKEVSHLARLIDDNELNISTDLESQAPLVRPFSVILGFYWCVVLT
jgi:hypothetical protein